MKSFALAMILLSIILLSGCVQEPAPQNPAEEAGLQDLEAAPEANTKDTDDFVPLADPVLLRARPYLDALVLEDVGLRSTAADLTLDCPFADKECQINALYRHVVGNLNYYTDPRQSEFIQSPSETMQVKGGDCEDLSILLISLLENLGTKTLLVLTPDHAYVLACDVNSDRLQYHVHKHFLEVIAADIEAEYAGQEIDVVIEGNDLYLEISSRQNFEVQGLYAYYTGGPGGPLPPEFDAFSISYSMSSAAPLDIYIVPSEESFDNFVVHKSYEQYKECKQSSVMGANDSCDLDEHGGLMLTNDYRDATDVDLIMTMRFKFAKNIIDEYFDATKIKYYDVDGETCVILEPSAGEFGYPGFEADVSGEKIAIDPISEEYYYLE